MLKLIATTTLASVTALAFAAAAQAQVTVPPGQDFYATPMSKGEMTMMPEAKIAMPAAAPGKKMMKRKMMKGKKKM